MPESENASAFSKMDESPETVDGPAAPCTPVADKPNAADASSASHTSAKESALTQKSQTQTPNQTEALKKREAEGSPSGMLNNPATPVTPTVTSAAMTPTLKVMVSSAPVRCTMPLVVGARVASAAWASGQTSATRFGGRGVVSNQVRPPAVTPTPQRAATVTVPQSPQARALQLPANFQIPQGMVLIHNASGQLMLVSQQALSQANTPGFMPKSSNIATAVGPQASQATTTSMIRVSIPSPPTMLATIVKPTSLIEKTVLKPSSTMGTTIGSTIIKQPSVLGTDIKPNSITGPTVIKAASAQNPPICNTTTTTVNQRTITLTNVPIGSVEKSIGTASFPSSVTQSVSPVGTGPRIWPPNIPIKEDGSIKVSSLVTVTAETLENVKKCRNFLVTLMKLTSSGNASSDVAQNVRNLVKDLLAGQLEAEGFTEKLYMELKSSPQQYLVPFLKKSLPGMRQFTPNPQLFIQQCEPPKVSSSSTIGSNTQKPGLSSSIGSNTQKPGLSSSIGSNTQKPGLSYSTVSQPTQAFQQPKGVKTNQRMTSSPQVVLPVQKYTHLKQPFIQTYTQRAGTFRKPHILQACRTTSRQTQAAQAPVFKGSTSGSFRDDDDINDVASMAGVNVNEENARILASSSQLVGTEVRSCRDELFLQTTALQQRVLHIGNSLGVTEVDPDVLGLLSNATQERLHNLLEKLLVVAHHHNSCKNDWRYIQTSDTRSQLKFLAQLEKVEKQRREEQEKETLLRLAKSRSNSEDPEQLRLKQRAKEMQRLELAQMAHRNANLAALAALGPRKRTFLEAFSSGTSQVAQAPRTNQQLPHRVTFRDLIFCMEQDRALKRSLKLYSAFLQ